MVPEGIHVALPSGYIDVFHSEGSIANLIEESDGQNILNLGNLDVANMDKKEFLTLQGAIEPLTVSWLKNKFSYGIYYQMTGKALFNYDKTIPSILLEGNAPYVGETVDVNFDLQTSLQHVYGFSVGYHLPYFAIAGRLKYYSGVFNLKTEDGTATLNTEENTYNIDFMSNYTLFKSGDLLQYSDDQFLLDGEQVFTSFVGRNFGVGADVGLKLNLSDQFNLNASILDLGTIRWRDNPQRWEGKRDIQERGIDLSGVLEDQSLDFQDLSDSIASFLQLDVSEEKYNTSLPTRIFLGMQYDINPALTIGLLYANEFNNQELFPTLAAQVTAHIGDIFHIGSVYSTKHGRFTNLGLHTLLQLGPVQLFALTDNLFDLVQFKPYGNAHIRGGINLHFNLDP